MKLNRGKGYFVLILKVKYFIYVFFFFNEFNDKNIFKVDNEIIYEIELLNSFWGIMW